MASFDYRFNPLYLIKECSSCRAFYTVNYCCSEGSLKDRIICDLNKTPNLSQEPPQNFPKCGNPVDGQYCQGCALLRKKFKKDLFTYCIENGILQDSSKPSNDNTNVVNALQEPFVVKHDPFPIIPDPEPFNNQTIDELPQTMPSFDPTCYSEDRNSFTYDSKSNLVHDSPNVFDPPPKPPLYSCKFCENDARYGHYCTPQVLFIYQELCYNQDFNFPQDFHDICITLMLSLILSLLNHDSLIISSSSKIDYLFDVFVGELTLLKSISSGINKIDCDPEEETRLIKILLYDNSFSRPPKEFISKNSNTAFKSFSPFPIPVEDSDFFIEEIDLSFTLDDPMPSGIEKDDYDSERDILILEELLSNDSLALSKNESFHFDIPSSPRPPAKPPDGNTGILNVKIMGDIYEHNVPMPRHMFTQPTLVPN
nr:hypothetical protein [Tanacetum cinerariifolium]